MLPHLPAGCLRLTLLAPLAAAAGAKVQASALRRRGGSAAQAYPLRQEALRRLHGKESVLSPLRTVLGQ